MALLQYYLIFAVVTNILYFITTWKLFQKAGRQAWESAIPVYNILVTLKIIHRSWWWIIIVFIPIVGPILACVIIVDFVRHFGKRNFVDNMLAIFLSFIYLGYLNYSPQTEYTGKEERKETFVSSIIFAVIVATIIHTFVIQPFIIPTGSMERTLLVGDGLFVSKLNYGVRIPVTPVGIPFLQNKIPGTGNSPEKQTNSYVDKIKLPYMRLPGWRNIERYDIVVFNFPIDSLHRAIDRKDPYVKRCVGLPGDKIEIINARLFINGQPEEIKADEDQQHSYIAYSKEPISNKKIENILGYADYHERISNSHYIYIFRGIPEKIAKEIGEFSSVDSIVENIDLKNNQIIVYKDEARKVLDTTNTIFPIDKHWNTDQYGSITIPKKGDIITLTSDNINIYDRLIKVYEYNKLEIKDGKFFINNQETNNYTIKQDYYWMMGDNRDNSLDSRFFGFVPEDHIIGTPIFTWLSLQGIFENDAQHPAKFKIRWNRMFVIPNTGESNKTNYLPHFLVLLVGYFVYDYMRAKKKKKEEKKD